MEKLLSTKEAAKFLGVTTRTIRNWKRLGKIFPRKTELGKDFYSEEQLGNFLKTISQTFPNTVQQLSPVTGKEDVTPVTKQDDKQARIAEAKNFFNLIFGAVHETKFSYLWLKRDDTKKTVPFDISTAERRRAMAQKAIEYSDSGFDVYFCTGLLDEPPKENERGTEDKITCRPVVVCDVDTLGGKHTNPKKYPAPSSVKDFLPFNLSVLVDSGYGGHGYCILAEPLAITEDNRADVKARNAKFIATIRFKAGKFSGAVDGVGDLTRVLRVPGTRNYKLGVSNDAPICRLVEVNPVRFTPADLDAKLNALIDEHEKNLPAPKPTEETKKSARARDNDFAELGNDYDAFRVQKMLDVIPVKNLSGEDWLAVISALKNLGFTYEEVDRLNQGGEHYNEEENRARWDSLKDSSFDIATLHGFAKKFGYEERAARREWYNLHPELSKKNAPDELKEISHDFVPNDEPPDDGEECTQDKIKSCPINLRLPSDFQFNKRGITFIKPATEKKPAAYLPASLTPVVVTKLLKPYTSGTTRYEIAFFSRGKWERAEIEPQQLLNPRKVFELTDCGIYIADAGLSAQFFRRMLKDNERAIPVITIYSKPGWYDDKFIYPVSNHNEDYQVARAGIDYAAMFATEGNAENWKSTFKIITDLSSIHRVFIGAALASSLLKIIHVPNFWLHINGPKNSAKTLLLRFAISAYGNPNELIATFDSSPKNRVSRAVGLNDLPQGIDELESLNTKGQEELQKSIYDYFGGLDGQKNKRNGEIKQVERFRGVRLSTGEQPLHKPTNKGGAFKRAIDFRISEPLFDSDTANYLYQFCEYNHGHFGRKWTEYLSDNQATIQADFSALSKEIFETCGGLFEPTHVRALCACAIAFGHFQRCISLVEDFQHKKAQADIRDVLRIIPTLAEIDDLKRSLALLASWVDEHPREFMEIGEKTDSTFDAKSFAGRVGVKYTDGRVGFFRNAFRQICEDKLGLPSYEKFLNEAFDAGKLDATNQRNKAKEKIIQGERKFLYIFKADVLIEVVDKERDLEAEKLANEYGF